MGLFERMEQAVIARGHQSGLEIEVVVEAAGSYPGKTVQDSVVADPKDSADNLCFAAVAVAAAAGGLVAERNLGIPAIRMGCRNSKDTVAAAAEPEGPALVRLKRQRD
jgi:hypothetical protein